jgi:hypothetical protein
VSTVVKAIGAHHRAGLALAGNWIDQGIFADQRASPAMTLGDMRALGVFSPMK